MKFIVDSTNKTITLLDKISIEEIEQLKIWLGDDAKNWVIDFKERIIEKDSWQPIITPPVPSNPFPFIPSSPFTNPFTEPFPFTPTNPYPNPFQPFYTVSLDDNEKEWMIECSSVNMLVDYDSLRREVTGFMSDKISQQ